MIQAASELEQKVMDDPRWQAGVQWGRPRRAHPEGKVLYHIEDILQTLSFMQLSSTQETDLRLIALIHDTFKKDVNPTLAKQGTNHHARRAAVFAREFVKPDLVQIIEKHDDAYNIWRAGNTYGNWQRARRRARNLIAELGDNISLYLLFYQADNACGDKSPTPLAWFSKLCAENS